MKTRIGVILAAFAMLFGVPAVVTACANPQPARPIAPARSITPSAQPKAISPIQSSELSNGTVTFDEYQAAFRRFTACAQQAGFNVSVGSLQYNVYNYRLTEAAANSKQVEHCYDFEFGQVDTAWQVANENTSSTSVHLSECLKKQGIPVPSTVKKMVELLEQASIDPTTCKRIG